MGSLPKELECGAGLVGKAFLDQLVRALQHVDDKLRRSLRVGVE